MNFPELRILLIEDNLGDARLILEMFHDEEAGTFELHHVTSMKEAAAFVAEGHVLDIILLDLSLPDVSGLDAVLRAQIIAPDKPVLVLTGLDDEILARQTMQLGAQDYLIKGRVESRALPRALRHSVERYRMQVENERLNTQQMRLKNEFLSHVSHELRAPLASILSFASILADGLAGETSTRQDEYLRIILNNVEQLQLMIEDLLEVSRMVSGRLRIEAQAFPIAEAIAHTVDSLCEIARFKQIEIAASSSSLGNSGPCPPVDLPDAFADPKRVRQVLTILLDNAIKFTPPGGAISVCESICANDPQLVQVTVSDTGCGIPAEERELIFQNLYQVADLAAVARNGLGMGLYIARELVSRMGGRIWVESAPDQGSRFCFTLPLCSQESLLAPSAMAELTAK